MYHLSAPVQAEITVKKSRFIGCLIPLTDDQQVKPLLAELRRLHPKASHFCYAYIIDSANMRSNDDGEPAGCAGVPLLNLLIHHQLEQVIVVVIRYFGGVLLGASNLLRAYQNAGAAAVSAGQLTCPQTLNEYSIAFPYDLIGKVEHLLSDAQITAKQYENGQVVYHYLTRKDYQPALSAVSAGRIVCQLIGSQSIEVPANQSEN